ncbi:MAG: SAM-dependent methyltransferase [Acidobacteriota bacterium]
MKASSPPGSGTGSVVFVGTGFALMSQATLEAVSHIERAQKLFYLVSDPAAALWLQSLNGSAESLATHYAEGKRRSESYVEMVDHVIAHARAGERVCVALYGHPGVGCDPTHMVMARARAEGFSARILPGVSSDACLYADLGIDPMDDGIQAYEASLFTFRRPRIDTRAPLLLWQAGFVGESSIKFSGQFNRAGARQLAAVLTTYYDPAHRVAIYEASWYPICPPSIAWTAIRSLPTRMKSAGVTLYIPAVETIHAAGQPAARRKKAPARRLA